MQQCISDYKQRWTRSSVVIGGDQIQCCHWWRPDPVLVIGGDQIVFVVSLCKTWYFDDHNHAYVISVTSHRSLFCTLKDHNVYHGHTLSDGLHYSLTSCCKFRLCHSHITCIHASAFCLYTTCIYM